LRCPRVHGVTVSGDSPARARPARNAGDCRSRPGGPPRPPSAPRSPAPTGSSRGRELQPGRRPKNRRRAARPRMPDQIAEGVEQVVAGVVGELQRPVARTRTNPGRPPRWEASAPPSGCQVAVKNVSAPATSARVRASRDEETRTSPPLSPTSRGFWMYFGQAEPRRRALMRDAPAARKPAVRARSRAPSRRAPRR
jgi:hypothetical protein